MKRFSQQPIYDFVQPKNPGLSPFTPLSFAAIGSLLSITSSLYVISPVS